MKKVLVTVLALIMCLTSISAFAAGKEFTDVKTSDWFYNDVKTAVELGLVNGRTETTYAPADKLTYAEAIKLAACMHQLYTTGKIDIKSGNPWYMPYVDYCKNNNIIKTDYNYQENATRAGYMGIFANALPGDGLKAINSVADDSIPDVPSSASYAAGVYKLYRAGILQGVDAAHNCNPHNNITRAEVAAILTRMMNSDKRVKFTLGEEKEEVFEPITCVKQPIGGEITLGGAIATTAGFTGGASSYYSYQWEYNDGSGWKNVTSALGKVSGEDTVRVSIKSSVVASYKIRCVATDTKGNKGISDTVDFIFNAPLNIEKQPTNVTAEAGKAMTVSVKAAGGTPPYKYEWISEVPNNTGTTLHSLIGAADVKGADTDKLTYVASAANTTSVHCIVTDALGEKVRSNTVTLVATSVEEEKVEEPVREKLEIESKPASVTVSVNETAVCEVSVKGGTAPYKYQWYYVRDNTLIKFKDSDVEGVLTKKLSVTKNAAEVIDVRCVITDATGANIVSPVATITIEENNNIDNNKLELVAQPTSTNVKVGEDAKLSVETKGGSGTLTYKWQMDISGKGGWINMTENDVWLGTATPELTVKSNTAANLLIRCIITDTTNNVIIETEGVNVIFE